MSFSVKGHSIWGKTFATKKSLRKGKVELERLKPWDLEKNKKDRFSRKLRILGSGGMRGTKTLRQENYWEECCEENCNDKGNLQNRSG